MCSWRRQPRGHLCAHSLKLLRQEGNAFPQIAVLFPYPLDSDPEATDLRSQFLIAGVHFCFGRPSPSWSATPDQMISRSSVRASLFLRHSTELRGPAPLSLSMPPFRTSYSAV